MRTTSKILACLLLIAVGAARGAAQGIPAWDPIVKQIKASTNQQPVQAAATATPAPAGAAPKINVVAVGYDIDKNDNARKMLEKLVATANKSGASGKLILAGQDKNALNQAMDSAMDLAVNKSTNQPPPPPPPPPKLTLDLKTPRAKPGDPILVVHSPAAVTNKAAWIGFYRGKDTPSKDYISYTFLNNLKDRAYDVTAPDEPGKYHFRIFLDEGYEPAAVSAECEIKAD